MSEQSAFNPQHLQEAPLLVNPGLLDQLGLPPNVIRYLRKHQRRAWIVTGCIVTIIIVVSLYNSYITYREDKAASALTAALKADETTRTELLNKVVEDYGSSSAGLWARIELAQRTLAQGDSDQAIAELQDVLKSVGKKSPLTPLLQVKLAGVYENRNDREQALVLYNDLSQFQGFETLAYEAMGRIYEFQGKKDKALEMYQKYLAIGSEEGGAPSVPASSDSEREMIEARIKTLQE